MQDVSWVPIAEVGRGDIDDGHIIADLHLLVNAGQVVGLTDVFVVHLGEVHGSMVQLLAMEMRRGTKLGKIKITIVYFLS